MVYVRPNRQSSTHCARAGCETVLDPFAPIGPGSEKDPNILRSVVAVNTRANYSPARAVV